MATFTKAQILALIASELPDNTSNQITPEDLRGVLNSFTDMVQTADFIYYTHEDLAGVTHVKGALDAIVALIEAGTVLTAAQIVTLLESLTGTDRLNKSAVRGADFALNRRSKGNVTDSASYHATMTNILKGDYWVFDDGTGSPSDGGRDDLNNGDLVIALVNNATLYATATGYLESEDWEVYKFSSENNLTAGDIRDLLETLEGENMLDGAKVKYSSSKTLIVKIDELNSEFLNTQKKLHKTRVTVTSEGTSITVSGNLNIVMMSISHLMYFGIEGSAGAYAGWDFVYQHSGGDTIITLNPSFAISFENGSVVDIIYYNDDLIV
jgi:hypothetical protein